VIVVVGHTKGGVAKTSLALALAIRRASQGRDVLLVDADEQQTASKFAALRTSLETGGASYQTAAYIGRADFWLCPRISRISRQSNHDGA